MTGKEKGYKPQDAAAGWALTLLRPLLHPRRRAVFEDAMADAFVTDPDWCRNYVSGVLVCLVSTLPNNDPWRHISARSHELVSGDRPPADNRVIRNDTGRTFGTWRDATDLIAPVFAEPVSDPSLAELSEQLSPEAGLLLAASGGGDWRQVRQLLVSLTDQLADNVDDFGRSHAVVIGRLARDVVREAIAWALHRRMAYGGDVFCEEMLLRWTTLATRITLIGGQAKDLEFASAYLRAAEMTDNEVQATIVRYLIPDDVRDGIGDVIGDDGDLGGWSDTPI